MPTVQPFFFRNIERDTLLRHLSSHNFSYNNGTDNGNDLPYIINFETMDNNVTYFSRDNAHEESNSIFYAPDRKLTRPSYIICFLRPQNILR